jgi:hypothetical protein
MFSHPENPRHPMSVRIHPELPYFSFALTQQASYVVRSGQSLDLRFRALVHDGRPDRALNALIRADFENPAEAHFEPAKD